MIVEEIKKASVNALREKNENVRNISSVVLNKIKLAEIALRSQNKTLTDADAVAILLKTQKELEEERENYLKVSNAERAALILGQIEFIKEYLPKMLSAQEIEKIIAPLEDKSVPAVMRHFKIYYAGQCDMRLVQEVLKKLS